MYIQTYRFPLYSTGLRPLKVPSGAAVLFMSPLSLKIPEQGKGTNDHLLPGLFLNLVYFDDFNNDNLENLII